MSITPAELSPNGQPAAPIFPKRGRSTLQIDAETVVQSVTERIEGIQNDRDRGEWMERRLQRYAKYRGWLTEKTFPWAGASNVHVPLLPIAELRANAGLHNVVMTLRPLLTAKASNPAHIERAPRVTELVNAQMLVEPGPQMAERRFGDFISNFLQDGNAVAFTPWVRDEREITQVRHWPPIPDGVAPSDYLEAAFRKLFPTFAGMDLDPKRDNRFAVSYLTGGMKNPRGMTAQIDVYTAGDDSGGLEFVIKTTETVHDGPVMINLPISAVLAPTRAENLQPPSDANPGGAPYVVVLCRMRVDEILRKQRSGEFNWLSQADLQTIIDKAKGDTGIQSDKPEEELAQQKDDLEGVQHAEPPATYDEGIGHLSVPMAMVFDRWDVDGDGLADDVYWMVARDAKVLCEARLLTEKWPSRKPYRPLAEAIAIPVPGRWYGISLLELGESMYDMIKATFDQSYDAWTIANLPTFFYAASSKMQTEPIHLAPGEGHPVPGDPRQNVYIPQWPQRDQSAAMNLIGLGSQFFERVMMIGGLQLGQVPTGKASALRTMGTTVALLQQGDVRADQLLLRLFGGIAQVATFFHAMNRVLLPDGKEFRVLGWDGPEKEGYVKIESVADEIDIDTEFEFRPDFLLSNPAVLSQTIQTLMGVLVQPLMYQMGITDANLTYRLVRDFIRALRLDPKLYVKPPVLEAAPPMLAEEVISTIQTGQPVEAVPVEPVQDHLSKLMAYMNSEAFGLLDGPAIGYFRVHLERVVQRARAEQMAHQAQAFQDAMTAQGMGGQGGVATTAQEPGILPQQTEMPTGPEAINA